MSTSTPSIAENFSLREARSAIQQYMAPNPVIYWTDFLLTILVGHICFGVARTLTAELYMLSWAPPGGWRSPVSPLLPTSQVLRIWIHAGTSVGACLLFYRASMFIHELVHLRRRTFNYFRFAWNALCGIPFLMPSFVYYTHVDHHRREHYGTQTDGEYLPLSHVRPAMILLWTLHPFLLPPLTVFRFLILGPIGWFIPPLRKIAHERFSSLIIDPTYIRPMPSKARLRAIRLQEFLCLLWCCFLPIFAIRTFGGLLPFLVQAYFTGVALLFINGLRTLGAHRWLNTGERMTFVEQLLDSVNYPKHGWITGLWGPVGTRYHALHHLFPTMPYHNFPAAHRALMKHLPENSPYRKTSAQSLTGSLLKLYRRAAENWRRRHDTPITETGSRI